MNSGDWVENLSALELADGQWRLFKFEESGLHKSVIPKSKGEMVTTSAMRKSFRVTKGLLRFW